MRVGATALLLLAAAPADAAIAYFAMGCFWHARGAFRGVAGVRDVQMGYMGGFTRKPDQQTVASGSTGHAETISVHFDPSVSSYRQLLDTFWTGHSPFQRHGQGLDVGSQFRVAVFTIDADQRRAAVSFLADAGRRDPRSRVAVAKVEPASTFYPARTANGSEPLWHCQGAPPPGIGNWRRRRKQRPDIPVLVEPQHGVPAAVEFEEGRGSGTVRIFAPAGDWKGSLRYTVDGAERPPLASIRYDAAARALRFPDINRAVALPRRGYSEAAAAVRALANERGVPHSIPGDEALAEARTEWAKGLPPVITAFMAAHSAKALADDAAVCARRFAIATWECPTAPRSHAGELLTAFAHALAANRSLVVDVPSDDVCADFVHLRSWMPRLNETEELLRRRCGGNVSLRSGVEVVRWPQKRAAGRLSTSETAFACCTMPWRAQVIELHGGTHLQAAWMTHNQAAHPTMAQQIRDLFYSGAAAAYSALARASTRWTPRIVYGVEKALVRARARFTVAVDIRHSKSDEKAGMDALVDQTAAQCVEEALQRRNGSACAVLVASDRAEARYFIRDRFSKRCEVIARPGADATAGGSRDGLFDAYMLSRADALVGVRGSPFSELVAHHFADTATHGSRVWLAHAKTKSCRPLMRLAEPAPRCMGTPSHCPTPGAVVAAATEDEKESAFLRAFRAAAGVG